MVIVGVGDRAEHGFGLEVAQRVADILRISRPGLLDRCEDHLHRCIGVEASEIGCIASLGGVAIDHLRHHRLLVGIVQLISDDGKRGGDEHSLNVLLAPLDEVVSRNGVAGDDRDTDPGGRILCGECERRRAGDEHREDVSAGRLRLGDCCGVVGSRAIVSILVDSADEQVAADLVTPFREIGTVVAERVLQESYGTIVNQPPPPTPPPGDPNIRSALLEHLTPELAGVIADAFAGPDVLAVQFRGLGGAVGDVAAGETLFSARTANVAINATGLSADGIEAVWKRITPHAVGVYLAFASGRGSDRVEAAYPATTIQRIRTLKAEVDPDGLFNDSFALD